jgi:hypothetical protein
MPSKIIPDIVPSVSRQVKQLIDSAPWEYISGIQPQFVERLMFVPGADGRFMLDENGNRILTNIGRQLYQQSGGDPMELVSRAMDYSGDEARAVQGAVYGKDGSLIAVNEPEEPFELIVSNLRKHSPRGSLQNPRDMKENIPYGSDRPESPMEPELQREGTPVLGDGLDINSGETSVSDPSPGVAWNNNPFIVGPLVGAPTMAAAALYLNEQEKAKSPYENSR